MSRRKKKKKKGVLQHTGTDAGMYTDELTAEVQVYLATPRGPGVDVWTRL